VTALAGTRTTTLIATLASCYRDAGYVVIGTAPTARAARELRSTACVLAGTMHALLAELDRGGGFPDRSVLVIDEAGMAPTRITTGIFAHAARVGTKIIAVGDPGQPASVQAGGWLAALADRHPGPQLREVIRQRDPGEREALEALHGGRPATYLEHKKDAITVRADEAQAVDALIEQWHAARHEHGPDGVVMLARDNNTRETLNHAGRARLKEDGALPQRRVFVGHREYASGDRVITRRNDLLADIDNGTLATVLAIDDRRHQMVIQTAAGAQRVLDLAYVARHVEYAYALTGHGAQGATAIWVGVVGRPEEFTREWAYTALSRARDRTTLRVIGPASSSVRERAHNTPSEEQRIYDRVLYNLCRAMNRSEAEPPAVLRELQTPLTHDAEGQPRGPHRPADTQPGRRTPFDAALSLEPSGPQWRPVSRPRRGPRGGL